MVRFTVCACGTLEKTIVNWYTKEYFLLRIFDIDFGLKNVNGKKTSFKPINK